MTKQEFAIKLLFWIMPFPLSKSLPKILRRFLGDPSSPGALISAQAAFRNLLRAYDYTMDYAALFSSEFERHADLSYFQSLLDAILAAIEAAKKALADLEEIISNLGDHTTDEIVDGFTDVVDALDDVTVSTDTASDAVPGLPVPDPPRYTPPFPPLYSGPPSPGPGGPSSPPRVGLAVSLPWFYDAFDTIDPAVWTDYSDGTGSTSIVGHKLKMFSSSGGDIAWLETDTDDTIPQAFTFEFELNVASGSGELRFFLYTGVYAWGIIFVAPDTLRFRRAVPDGYINIDVGDFMNQTYIWKFVFNGTTCDIYRGTDLIAAGLSINAHAAIKGRRVLDLEDILTAYIDNYTITPL